LEKEVLPGYAGKVKFYYKHLPLPFHPWAESAAIAQECVKAQSADAGWAVYNGFFDKQKEITVANVKDKTLEFVGTTKIDTDKFNKCYDNKETAEQIRADKAEAAALGITGTPSFVINGRMVKGAQPADKFKAIIDDELGPKT
jgi:protein-disulfide isomerase